MVSTACRKEYLSGDISGIITSYDHYGQAESDNSGVEISILRDSGLVANSITDISGRYFFKKLPYGKFTVDYRKDGFTRPYSLKTLNHLGGGVPLYSNYSIYEVPQYELHLDSLSRGKYSYEKYIYLKIDGDTILKSRSFASFLVFASHNSDVSKSSFSASGKGYLTDRIDYSTDRRVAVKGVVADLEDIGYKMGADDSIYIVAYPLAAGQGYMFWEYLDGALGRQSNVIRCKWLK